MKRISVALLVVVAGLAGCATTETPDSKPAAPAPSSPSKPSTGAAPKAPVDKGAGMGTAGPQQPDLKRSVYYEFDKYDVKAEYRSLVESHAAWLKANPKARLTIEGNADERGSREYNVALGQRRAESVTKMLVLMGVKPEQVEAISWGEEKPRRTGHDETSWTENRRSDFAAR